MDQRTTSTDLSSSLLDLENEIQATVQQLKDDLQGNQELYDAIDNIDQPFPPHIDNHLNLGIDTSISPVKSHQHNNQKTTSSTNDTGFFTPNSVLHQNKNIPTRSNINVSDMLQIQLPQQSKLVNLHNTDTISIQSNGSTISNRSDKRAMFKAFLRSKTDSNNSNIIKEESENEYTEIRSEPDNHDNHDDLPDIPGPSAESKPEEFQKLLDELNHEIQENKKDTSEFDPEPSLTISPLANPAIMQKLLDQDTNNNSIQLPLPTNTDVSNFKASESLHIDEDEIIDDGNSETQQELSDLLQEIEVSQKQFQDQLIHVDQEFLSMRDPENSVNLVSKENNHPNTKIPDNVQVHFEDDMKIQNKNRNIFRNRAGLKLRMSQSLDSSPRRSRAKSYMSPYGKCHSVGSPVRISTDTDSKDMTRSKTTKSTQFEFGTGRELLWEKQLRERLENEDPLAVNLDKIASPRRFKRLKLMVDRAQNPTECTFQPKVNNGLPSMYPAINNLHNQPFLQRQQQWVHATNKKLEFEQTQLRLKEQNECPFTPQINRNTKYDYYSFGDSSSENVGLLNGKRNSHRHRKSEIGFASNTMTLKKKRLIQQIKDKEKEEFNKNCTFKPRLCRNSKRIAKQLKEHPKFKKKIKHELKIHYDDDEMRECTFKPEINRNKIDKLNLNHVIEYIQTDPFNRLSTTSGLKINPKSHEELKREYYDYMESQKHKYSKQEREEMTRDFFTRLEIDNEIRKSHQRKLKKAANPKFQPKICKKSMKLVNKSGLKFEDRQSLSLENKQYILQRHELAQKEQVLMNENIKNELKFKPELNRKSVSMVENKKVPRNGAGYSRANYYFYANKKDEVKNKKYENKKILKQPKLAKYLSIDVVQRLNDPKNPNKKNLRVDTGNKDEEEIEEKSNDKKMSERELEDFISRQEKYEKQRKKRIQRLWKQFNMEEENLLNGSGVERSENVLENEKEKEMRSESVSNLISPVKSSRSMNEDISTMSYTQLFNSKNSDNNKEKKKKSKPLDVSYSRMHSDTKFVSI